MSRAVYQVNAFLSEDQRHSPYVISGLLALEKSGTIHLKFRSQGLLFRNRWIQEGNKGERDSKGYPWCVELEVIRIADQRKIRIAIDLQDWEEMHSYHALKHCNFIYKRAFPLQAEELKIHGKKVFPFGPNQSARIKDARVLKTWKYATYLKYLSRIMSEPGSSFRKILKATNTPAPVSSPVSNYSRSIPEHPYIFFQVQCHTWKNNKLSAGLNEMRAELIRRFRNEFGNAFAGGMFFNGPIDEDYRDCLTDIDPKPDNYKNFVKSAAVVISTNGFGNSIPWKFMEYLQWGCCIVSEQSKHQMPSSPQEEVFLTFNQVDEAIQLCRMLLESPEKREAMKKAASRFYSEKLEPEAAVLNTINHSLGIAG